MRKAIIKNWIKPEYEKDFSLEVKEGTGRYSDFKEEVTFLDWGHHFLELGENVAPTQTAAIVEHKNGTVSLVQVENIKFIE